MNPNDPEFTYEDGIANWMMQASLNYLKDQGFSSAEEWNIAHPGQDFYSFYAEIA